MITYVKGDATKPIGDGPKIIAHVCNDEGGWGSGFVLAVDKLSPRPKNFYKNEYAFYANAGYAFMPLGVIDVVPVGGDTYVCNMIAQHQTIRNQPRPLCYKSLEICLTKLAEYAVAEGATIHMPRIGCGLAGGDWSVVESIINRTLKDVDVTVYDL